LLASLAVAAGCSGSDVPLTAESLAEARRAWREAGVRDYNLEWLIRGAENGMYLAYVRDGRMAQARVVQPDGREVILSGADAESCGVEGLFRRLEAGLARNRGVPEARISFWPDPALGYPRRYRCEGPDAGPNTRLDVVRIDTRPPRHVPPLPPFRGAE
jgi:hypothetical protein